MEALKHYAFALPFLKLIDKKLLCYRLDFEIVCHITSAVNLF